jgi:hypothetical protein
MPPIPVTPVSTNRRLGQIVPGPDENINIYCRDGTGQPISIDGLRLVFQGRERPLVFFSNDVLVHNLAVRFAQLFRV